MASILHLGNVFFRDDKQECGKGLSVNGGWSICGCVGLQNDKTAREIEIVEGGAIDSSDMDSNLDTEI